MKENSRGKQDFQQGMPAFICQRCITWRTEFFYLSGPRLAMEKLNFLSLETGLVIQFLSKTYNPWETC